MAEHAPARGPAERSVLIPGPDGRSFRLTKPDPDSGPWRPHEREMAPSLGGVDDEVLLPAEAFDDDTATDEDRERLLGPDHSGAVAADSETVRLRMCSSCAGWPERPQPAELYAAIRAENPAARERAILRMWVTETDWTELIRAWAERVYTLRELVAALHRAGIARSRHSRTLNRWAARRDGPA